MKFKRSFRVKKSRKYPIKRDGEGLSLRARCFELFEQGKRPVEFTEELKMNKATAYRYFRDWKKLDPDFERKYAFVKSLFNKTAPDREGNIQLFAQAWGIEKERLETILAQPHGLKRLLTGKLYFPTHGDVDHKLHISLELARLISDHLIKNGGNFTDVYFALNRHMQENKKYREEEDTAIKRENELIKIVHAIFAIEIKNEREGRIKRDRLTEEERIIVIKRGIEKEKRKTEISYWLRIGVLMAQGLTQEEAREKIYQDVLDKGDPKIIKIFREFQNKVHPVKTDDQLLPPSPPQPSS